MIGLFRLRQKSETVGKAVFGDKYRSMIKTPKSVVPYVPLTRTGQYNVVWRSNQLKAERQMLKKLKEQKDALEAEEKEIPSALTNAIKNTEEKIDAMERSADHYIVSRFDSLAEAGDYQKKLSNIQSGNKATLMDIGDQQKKSLTGQANIDRMLSDFEEKFEEHYGQRHGGCHAPDRSRNVLGKCAEDNALCDQAEEKRRRCQPARHGNIHAPCQHGCLDALQPCPWQEHLECVYCSG